MLLPFLPASGGFYSLWCSLACRCITPASASVTAWPSPSVSVSELPSSHKGHHYELGHILPQYDLILTGLYLQRPYFK